MEKFPGHIACDGASKSEVVVPIVKDGQVCFLFLYSVECEVCGID